MIPKTMVNNGITRVTQKGNNMNVKKLWNKGNITLDPIIEAFETKDDLILDQKLIAYDVAGSIAHAKMLCKIGILSKQELEKLEKGLLEIAKRNEQGKFQLQLGDEDMHTKIENYLTKKYGDVGQKLHTGRSRNDQVLTVLRLYSKDQLKTIEAQLGVLVQSFQTFSQKYGTIAMPGYTHMQKAMPSSVGMWAESFSEALLDDLASLTHVMKLTDQSPLGSAAGYGLPIDVDREYAGKLMGFGKVQSNSLYCQNSRGKFEAAILAALIQILLTINKFASDVMLFTTVEFSYFTVSDSVTTGSSIMPQKKNVDAAELLRSKVHVVLGNYTQIVSMSSNLISGYNRDMQDSKKPFIESVEITLGALKVAIILLSSLTPNKNVLEAAMTEEMFSTQEALTLVKKGVPFRKAYRKVKYENKK